LSPIRFLFPPLRPPLHLLHDPVPHPSSGDVLAAITASIGWRAGIGLWAGVYPFTTLFMIVPLVLAQRRARSAGKLDGYLTPYQRLGWKKLAVELFHELDVVGSILVCSVRRFPFPTAHTRLPQLIGSLILVLLPFTLAGGVAKSWQSAKNIAMLVIGVVVCIPGFIIWETKFARGTSAFSWLRSEETDPFFSSVPCVPFHLLNNRTVLGCFGLAVSLNLGWYMQGERALANPISNNADSPYFLSFLLSFPFLPFLDTASFRHRLYRSHYTVNNLRRLHLHGPGRRNGRKRQERNKDQLPLLLHFRHNRDDLRSRRTLHPPEVEALHHGRCLHLVHRFRTPHRVPRRRQFSRRYHWGTGRPRCCVRRPLLPFSSHTLLSIPHPLPHQPSTFLFSPLPASTCTRFPIDVSLHTVAVSSLIQHKLSSRPPVHTLPLSSSPSSN
jgi:hypothetical protein